MRNPVDIIPSLFYLFHTGSHTLTTNEKPNEADPEWWDRFVNVMARALNQHIEVMKRVEEAVPTYYLRYEDLCLNPLPVLTELFCFLFEVPSI